MKEKNNKNVKNSKKVEANVYDKEYKQNKKILYIFIIILIVFIVVFGIIFMLNRNNENESFSNKILTEEHIVNEVEKGQESHDTIQKDNLENAELINGEKYNTSEALLKERTWNELLLKDIELYSENGMTVFSVNVVNETNKDIEDQVIQVLFKDNEGNVYGKVNGYIGDIKAENTKKLYITTSNDYTNAYDFEIEASN